MGLNYFYSMVVMCILLSSCIAENGKIIVTVVNKPSFKTHNFILSYSNISSYSSASNTFLPTSSSFSGEGDGVFKNPFKMAVDATNGYIYVVDSGNNRIQKFDLTGLYVGSIGATLGGGTCVEGAQSAWCRGGLFISGNTDGTFHSPRAVKLDIPRNIFYVADLYRIQKFNLSTGAFLGAIGHSTASGTCLSGSQNTWCSNGQFSTGSQDGMFNGASALDVNFGQDLLIVSESNNHRIQKFSLSTGAYIGSIGKSTAAGTCIAGKQNSWCAGGVFSLGDGDGLFDQPSGVAIDASSNTLLVANYYNDSVQKFNLTSGAFIGSIGMGMFPNGTCVFGKQPGWCVGGTFDYDDREGGFWRPSDISIDAAGDLMYVSDVFGSKIQKFTLSTGAYIGAIGFSTYASGTCVAGIQPGWCFNGAHSFDSDSINGGFSVVNGITVDVANNVLYSVETNANRVQKFNLATGAYQSTLNGVFNPLTTWKKVTDSGSPINTAFVEYSLTSPKDFVADEINNRLYVLDESTVKKFNLTTGAYIGAIGKSTASGTCILGKQNSWCTGGVFNGGVGDGEFSSPTALAIDVVEDLLYVASSDKIQKFTLSTGAFIGSVGRSTASGTCISGAQSTWCTGGVFSTGAADGMFNGISALALDHDNGYLYITESFNRRIQRISISTGAAAGAIGNSSNSGTCSLGSQNNWCSGGVFSYSTIDGGFANPRSITLDVQNNYFYVGDVYKVSKFILSSGNFVGAIGKSTAAGTCDVGLQSHWCSGGVFSSGASDGTFLGIADIEIDLENDLLYVGNSSSIQKFNLTGGNFLGAIGFSGQSGTCLKGPQLQWCTGGVFESSKTDGAFTSLNRVRVIDADLYVSDEGRIQRIIQK